jgi:FMN reductase
MNPQPFKLLGVAGSMRDGSRVKLAVRRALEEAESFGAQTRLLDLRALELPMFRPGENEGESVRTAHEAVAWADGYLLGTPDYHGSMSGAVKNFLDFHWREFAGKLFGYACASHEKGLLPMEQMRTSVRQCYGWSLPYGASFNPNEAFSRDGNLQDAALERRLRMTARDLVVYGSALRTQWQHDLADDTGDTFAARYRK